MGGVIKIYKKHYFLSLKLFQDNTAYLSLEVLKGIQLMIISFELAKRRNELSLIDIINMI